MVKPKGTSRLIAVKEFLMEKNIQSGNDIEYGNTTGRTIPLEGKYEGAVINCFNTGTVNVQGSGDNLEEIKIIINSAFPKKK